MVYLVYFLLTLIRSDASWSSLCKSPQELGLPLQIMQFVTIISPLHLAKSAFIEDSTFIDKP